MRERLAKFASTSRQLHRAVLIKESGLFGAIGKLGLNVLKAHPVQAPLAAAGLVGGALAAKGKYQQYQAGFDPQGQKAMLGQAPVPPGA